MYCIWILLFLSVEMTLITESSASVYQNILRKFDVKPVGDDLDDKVSHEGEQYYNQGLDCTFPRDCAEFQKCGQKESGVYRVYPYGVGPGFLVSCDMTTRGGGWLIFQRRQDGSVDFYRNWQNYTDGFGNLYGEFWLGLEKIHLLTSQGNYKLFILLQSYDNGTGYAAYDKFFVSDITTNFRLRVGEYSGSVGDSLRAHNGFGFSTHDCDNDNTRSHCATRYSGAWWYNSCYWSNLNGLYLNVTRKTTDNSKSANWWSWKKSYMPLQFTEMMLRPV